MKRKTILLALLISNIGIAHAASSPEQTKNSQNLSVFDVEFDYKNMSYKFHSAMGKDGKIEGKMQSNTSIISGYKKVGETSYIAIPLTVTEGLEYTIERKKDGSFYISYSFLDKPVLEKVFNNGMDYTKVVDQDKSGDGFTVFLQKDKKYCTSDYETGFCVTAQ